MDDFLVIADGTRLESQLARHDPSAFGESLAKAREHFGYAMCHCTSPARKLVIRRLGHAHHLAVWPEDGPNHHLRCAFYREQSAPTGPDLDLPAAMETEHGLDVKLDFALVESAPPVGASGPTPSAPNTTFTAPRAVSPTRHRKGLALAELLDLLWSRADLARWMPGWSRDYWRVHWQLSCASNEIQVCQQALGELLFVPPPVNGGRRPDALAQWESFAEAMAGGGESKVSRLLLGEVHTIEPSKFGWALRLKQFAPTVFVDDASHDQLEMDPAFQLAVHCTEQAQQRGDPGAEPSARLIACCRVRRSKSGNLKLVEAALMCTDGSFIPIHTLAERQLSTYLVKSRRNFSRPLPIAATGAPAFELRDSEPPARLYVEHDSDVEPGGHGPTTTTSPPQDGWQSWFWHPTENWRWPPLPASASRARV